MGFLDPIPGPGHPDIRLVRAAGRQLPLGIMRQQETRALRSGFFESFPEAAGAADDALSAGG